MTQLTKGMYGTEFERTGNTFGLRCGQMHSEGKVTHNSGWYNKKGEKLGWGDLSADDFRRISIELDESEVFLVLSERDSFWNFIVTSPGPTHQSSDTRPESEAPGIDYVMAHAVYIVVRNGLYYVNRYGGTDAEDREENGLRFKLLRPESVQALVNAGGPV